MECRIVPNWALCVCVLGFAMAPIGGNAAEPVETIDVEPVWTGHPVGFSLLTCPPYQYVAYYNADRQMTVAQRELAGTEWVFAHLPARVGWDSHNYVTMAVDRDGHLHVAGNMHCVPLVYFRTVKVGDVQSLTRVAKMIGPEREKRVTYPVFLHGPAAQLIFRYRDGSSGNGDDIYNEYDEATRTWRRLMNRPLTSGRGKMNAYCSRPELGPDGYYHVVWVWRDTPDCATNHDLSYARSRDLVHWETASGKKLILPITIGSGAVVDPVPPHGGIINGGHRLGFDSRNRPVIAYHKFDADGNTQIYVARFERSAWKVRRISDWTGYRWEFSGGGCIPFEVRLGAVTRVKQELRIACTYGRGRANWTLNATTLEPLGDAKKLPATVPKARPSATDLKTTRSSRSVGAVNRAAKPLAEGLRIRFADDQGSSDSGDHYFRLQWYSLGPNRDRPRAGPPPLPTMLKVLMYGK